MGIPVSNIIQGYGDTSFQKYPGIWGYQLPILPRDTGISYSNITQRYGDIIFQYYPGLRGYQFPILPRNMEIPVSNITQIWIYKIPILPRDMGIPVSNTTQRYGDTSFQYYPDMGIPVSNITLGWYETCKLLLCNSKYQRLQKFHTVHFSLHRIEWRKCSCRPTVKRCKKINYLDFTLNLIRVVCKFFLVKI